MIKDIEQYVKSYEECIEKIDRYRIQKSYKLLENEPPGKILDIGCMGGKYMLPLLKKGWDCYGVEISEACKIAQKRGIKCVRCDASKGLPFKDEFFDVIWAEEIIEHILDTDFFLSECNRVLKLNRILIISTPNLASLINRIKLLFGLYPRYVQYNNCGPGHVRYYTVNILKNQLKVHGFKTVRIIGNFLSLPDPTPNKVIRTYILAPLGTVFPTLSENIIIKARKVVAYNELYGGERIRKK